MKSGIVLVASLFIHPGHEGEFRQFETEAARIMKRYGGQIERIIRPIVSAQSSVTQQIEPHDLRTLYNVYIHCSHSQENEESLCKEAEGTRRSAKGGRYGK